MNKYLLFYRKHKATFEYVYLVLIGLLFTRLILSAFSIGTFNPSASVDGAWQYTLASFSHHNTLQVFSKDVFFTYGPLSTLLITTVHHTNSLKEVFFSNFLLLSITALLVWPLTLALKNLNTKVRLFYLVIFIFANIVGLAIDAIFLLTLYIIGNFLLDQDNKPVKLILLVGLIVLSFYKNSFLLTLVVSLPFIFLKVGKIKQSLTYLLIALSLMIITYLGLTGFHILQFWNFFYYAFISASTYNEYLAIPFGTADSNDIFVLLFSILTLVFLSTFRKGNWYHQLFKLVVIFIAYKQAIVRSDAHLLGFVIFVPIILFEMIDNIKKLRKYPYLRVVLILISIFASMIVYQQLNSIFATVTVKSDAVTISKSLSMQTFGFLKRFYAPSVVKIRASSGSEFSTIESTTSSARDNLNQYILDSKLSGVKIYNLSNLNFYAESLGYPVLHSVMIQNYASNPFGLFDNIQKDRLKNSSKNELVFSTDLALAIDNRHPFSDLSETFNYLFTNYKPIPNSQNQGLYIFEKYQDKFESCKIFSTTESTTDELIYLPSQEKKLQLRVNIHQSMLSKVTGYLLKPDEYTIILNNNNDSELKYRTFASTLQKGFYINPFYRSINDAFLNDNYKPTSFRLLSDSKNKMTVKLFTCE